MKHIPHNYQNMHTFFGCILLCFVVVILSPYIHESSRFSTPLQWRHNGRDSVSNHQPNDCLLNRLFRRRSKKTSKLRVTGLCVGNSPGTGEFPVQMASYAENVSIWWRHRVKRSTHHRNHECVYISWDVLCSCALVSKYHNGMTFTNYLLYVGTFSLDKADINLQLYQRS